MRIGNDLKMCPSGRNEVLELVGAGETFKSHSFEFYKIIKECENEVGDNVVAV
jgi:hypothetical protein